MAVAGLTFLAGGIAVAGLPATSGAATATSSAAKSRAVSSSTPPPCNQPSWCSRQLAPGLVWRWRTSGLPSGVPRVNVVEIDPRFARVAALESSNAPTGYEPVQSMARRSGAMVAINGGFFNNQTPPSPPAFRFVSMLKLDRAVVHANPAPRPALGMRGGAGHAFAFAVEPSASIDPLAAYPDAVGAGPFIVNPGKPPRAGVLSWSPEPGGFDWVCSPHPRSAAWLLADGRLVLGAFDGSSDSSGLRLDTPSSPYCTNHPNGVGTSASAPSLGQFILAEYPTTVQAMNLDGGGSTTFVVKANPFTYAIVNQPSVSPPRPVIDGLMVFAGTKAHTRPVRR